eukprot:9499355-Pyramimonas_sp.AAC.1
MPNRTRRPRSKARRKKAQPQGGEDFPARGAARKAGSRGRGRRSAPRVERASEDGGAGELPRPRERRPTSSRTRREHA